jgi:hypothetical protein
MLNRSKDFAERRRSVHRAWHKDAEIAKRERNDRRAKRRKMNETAISSEEDPSLPP